MPEDTKLRILITGGLGCVGANYAMHCLKRGDDVVVLDNQARGDSSQANEDWLFDYMYSQGIGDWLRSSRGPLRLVLGDVALPEVVQEAIKVFGGVDHVVHAAAQSSVNLSMAFPEADFASNVVGTFTLLEELRKSAPNAKVLYLASNKVYDVTEWPVELCGSRYRWVGNRQGPSEQFPFYTDAKEPYGASKIAGFYYSRCYAAMYKMPILVVVPSGMYGPQQYGRSVQGWLGWFVIASELKLPLTICGDGFQVRDMLHVQDVCSAFDRLFQVASVYPGEVFNLGGGVRNSISLVEALQCIEKVSGVTPEVIYEEWRPQDNKVYISNIEKMIALQWHPTVSVEDGIKEMCVWARSERDALQKLYVSNN